MQERKKNGVSQSQIGSIGNFMANQSVQSDEVLFLQAKGHEKSIK